jgi:hypothetical protein
MTLNNLPGAEQPVNDLPREAQAVAAATQFFDAVYSGSPGHLCIWTAADKRSRCFANNEDGHREAARYAIMRAQQTEVYYGVGLLAAPVASNRRGKVNDIGAIGALWADVDYGPGHKKAVPPDQDTALQLLGRVQPAPSIIVHSGQGVHAYWLFDGPWRFSDDADRARAARLSTAWQARIRREFEAEGYTLDSTADLARVLRLPGTLHRKDPANIRPVRVVHPDGALNGNLRRYAVREFEVGEPLLAEARTSGAAPLPAAVVVPTPHEEATSPARPEAELPHEKLLALMDNDDKFRRTWLRKRTDLRDQSASAYDMALANAALAAGWNDQEVAALIIKWREKHNEDTSKPLREDYMRQTLAKARAALGPGQTLSQVFSELALPVPEAASAQSPVDVRRAVLGKISKALGIPILRVLKHGSDAGRVNYVLVVSAPQDPNVTREISIGPARVLMNQNAVRALILEAVSKLVPRVKGGLWDQLCGALAAQAELIENEEADRRHEAVEWLRNYLSKCRIFGNDEWSRALQSNDPFRREDSVFIYVQSLITFIRFRLGDSQVTRPAVWEGLRLAGFHSKTVNAKIGGRSVTRMYWCGDARPYMDDGPDVCCSTQAESVNDDDPQTD